MSETDDGVVRKVPLAAQADEAHEALTLYYRVFSARVKSGEISDAEKEFHIGRMRALRNTLRLFAEFETEVRAALADALEKRRAREAFRAEADALRENETVSAVLEAFPGAEITDIRELEGAAND